MQGEWCGTELGSLQCTLVVVLRCAPWALPSRQQRTWPAARLGCQDDWKCDNDEVQQDAVHVGRCVAVDLSA